MGHAHRIDIGGEGRPVTGAQVAVLVGDRVLVQLRPFPPGWELPGGHCDPGEEPARTAAREASEETGFDIRVGPLVGVYSWRGLRRAGDAVYLAEIVGGRRRRSLEAWASRFAPVDALPRTLFPWYRQRIADAIAVRQGAPAVHRIQPVTLHHLAHFGAAWARVPLDLTRRRR